MNTPTDKSLLTRRQCAVFLFVIAAALAALALPQAQPAQQKALTIDDYSKWRSIERPVMSGDGKWVTYTLQFGVIADGRLTNVLPADAKPVLHLLNLDTNAEVTVADGTDATFSPDSRWVAYQVTPGGGQRGRGGRGGAGGAAAGGTDQTQVPASGQTGTQTGQSGRGGGAPTSPPRRAELRNLATGEVRSWQDIGTFAFAATSDYLWLRRRGGEAAPAAGGRGGGTPGGQPPGGAGQAGAAAGAATGARGVDAILLDLRTDRQLLLGSVADIAFNRTGDLLAYTVDAAVKDVNGLFVFDTRNGRTTTLDTDAKSYNRLAWNEDGNAIAVLKGSDVEKMRERDNVLVAFPDVASALRDGATVPEPVLLEPATADGFPKGWVASDRAALAWSEDNQRVFFGIKEQVPAPDTTRRTTDEAADVDVWNTADDRVQSLQMNRATQERNFTFRQAFDVSARRFVRLTDESMRDLDIAPDGRWAVGRDQRAYLADQKKEPAADYYRVDTTTGERTLIVTGQLTGPHVFGISPHGTHFLYWKDARFQAYNLERNTTQTLGVSKPPVSFIDVEDDHPGTKPSFGIAGFTSDGKAVIVNHQYDLYLLPLNGSAPTNLTGGFGSKHEMRFRLVRTEPVDPSVPRAVGPRGTFDLTKPATLSAYGQWTKKAGFYELAGGELRELVYEDASFSTPVKARKADRFLFTRQTFVEFPDLRVSGPGFADSKKITDANPQQKDFLWGHRELFDFKNKQGVRLQGILAVPDDYKPGEKRPMIVTFYEKNSQNMHVYTPPVYMVSMGRMPMQAVSDGYLTMMPDVHFRTGFSHSDMLECVEAATRKVIEMGYVDPKRIGITGHSYGGEGAAYVGTMSKMFAAVGMGAGVVDLYNDFNMNWGWSYAVQGGSGDTAFQYYLYDQGRWGFSPWDQPDRYHSESALTWAPKATAPFLIMHGTSDPTVGFINGLAFYNALRYNGKKAVLLAYPNEGHHLSGIANQRDLTVRFMEFFDHYLKGAPAPKWLSEGVPYLEKEASRGPAK
jgi:dipeptidyl aminopeptidase/acylaminoacyl peptidase